jgi:hypothetical protein
LISASVGIVGAERRPRFASIPGPEARGKATRCKNASQ